MLTGENREKPLGFWGDTTDNWNILKQNGWIFGKIAEREFGLLATLVTAPEVHSRDVHSVDRVL